MKTNRQVKRLQNKLERGKKTIRRMRQMPPEHYSRIDEERVARWTQMIEQKLMQLKERA